MKYRYIIFFILGLTILFLVSCEPKSEIDINKVNSDLTLEEALELFGSPRVSETSSDYPLVYSWEIGDDEILYLIFERSDRTEFKQKLKDGEFILPEESIQYGESGMRLLTDNELNVYKEWIMGHTPVCAYIVRNGEKIFLFDLQ